MRAKLMIFLLCALQAAYGQDKEIKLVYEAYYPEAPIGIQKMADPVAREENSRLYLEDKTEYTVRFCNQKYLCEQTFSTGKVGHSEICSPAEYIDFTDSTRIYQCSLDGKLYLVSGRTAAPQWEITGRTRQIGNYACMEARSGTGYMARTAWFAPEVPVGVGPVGLCGLPGLVVSLQYQERVFALKELSYAAASAIAPPKDGKRVTQEEFDRTYKAIEEESCKQQESGLHNKLITTIVHADGTEETVVEWQ